MYGKFDPFTIPDESSSSAYNLLFSLAALATTVFMLYSCIKRAQQVPYPTRTARLTAGALFKAVDWCHTARTQKNKKKITGYEGQILAMGPHFTGMDGFFVGAQLEGRVAPHIFATDLYNFIPGVKSLLEMFQAITIKEGAVKKGGRSAHADALDKAGQILRANGCIALFPQGNFSKQGQEAPIIYPGAANLALDNNAPIRVIRLCGVTSVKTRFLPLSVRNHGVFQAIGTALYPNNVRIIDCGVIDFHLKPENKDMPREEKFREICAQLYAFYSSIKDISDEEVADIKKRIARKEHLPVWDERLERHKQEKAAAAAKKQAPAKVEEKEQASASMSAGPTS